MFFKVSDWHCRVALEHLGTGNQDEPVLLSVVLNSGSNFVQSTLGVLFA